MDTHADRAHNLAAELIGRGAVRGDHRILAGLRAAYAATHWTRKVERLSFSAPAPFRRGPFIGRSLCSLTGQR